MARPLRIEFPGAVYHVTSRGDRREPIFADDEDRRAMLAVVEQARQAKQRQNSATHARFTVQAALPPIQASGRARQLITSRAQLEEIRRDSQYRGRIPFLEG